tara:strand:- start:523 stop:798 length:276 start_codon:yes stop_codon:yes gene_type:complete
MHKFDNALEYLICETLRGHHIGSMGEDELKRYTYKLGVALHNIPEELRKNRKLSVDTLVEIDLLDPSSTDETWGDWCRTFTNIIGQSLPNL